MDARAIISTHPDVRGSVSEALVAAIPEIYACAQACTACADACLAEEMVAELRQCIRTDLDCATICTASAEMANRRTGSNEPILRQMLELCVAACSACAEECERHAEMHEHCRICAERCRACAEACRKAIADVG